MKSLKILFQGDSITDGGRNRDKEQDWDGNHQIGHSYAFSVCGMLALENTDIEYTFVNRGISGNKIGDILNRAYDEIIGIAPDIMTLLCGINDGPVWDNIPTPPDVFKNTYENLLQICKDNLPDTKIILLEPFYLPVKPHDEHKEIWAELLPEYRKIIKALAQKFKAEYIELQAEFEAMTQYHSARYWLWDGIHPSEQGHGVIARKVFDSLKKYR